VPSRDSSAAPPLLYRSPSIVQSLNGAHRPLKLGTPRHEDCAWTSSWMNAECRRRYRDCGLNEALPHGVSIGPRIRRTESDGTELRSRPVRVEYLSLNEGHARKDGLPPACSLLLDEGAAPKSFYAGHGRFCDRSNLRARTQVGGELSRTFSTLPTRTY